MTLADMPQDLKISCSLFFAEAACVHLICKIAVEPCVWAAYSSSTSPLIIREA